ncbi:MAG TPA: amidohydrolase family protein [Acidimicrobiales bacterium]|nr:amidohydrolase family protein [Acidimicrobiales bacterium]
MAGNAVVLVSADCHAGAPVAAYRDYVEAELRDEYEAFLVARAEWVAERNRTMGLDDDAELVHALFGKDMVDSYEGDEAVSGGGANGVWDSARRQAELEPEGIVAEVLFPDFQNSNEPPWGAAFPFPWTDDRRRLAGARIYNRWLADFCAELPGRRAGLAIVQPHDVATAVADTRWARGAGLAGILLPTGDVGLASYHDRRYDPLWRECCDLGLPVTVHSGGTPWEGQGLEAMWVTKYEFLWWSHRPLWQMVLGGVFERFPSLELVFTEQGADWIPAVLSRLDEQYASPFERQITDVLRKSPTQYWRSNCYVGASFMSRGESLIRDQLGVDRIMWGSDYPHIEGTWPRTLPALKEALNGCSEAEVRMMLGETAAGVYGFDLDALRPLADRIGPRIGDLLSEECEPAVRYDPVDYALGRVSTRETTRRLMATLRGT